MMTRSPSLTSIPYVVRIHRCQNTPSTHANATCFLSDMSMLMRIALACRSARLSSRSCASSMRSCFASRSSCRSSWNSCTCLSIHSLAALFISRCALAKASWSSRLRIPRTTILLSMISRALAAVSSGTIGSQTDFIHLRMALLSLMSLGVMGV